MDNQFRYNLCEPIHYYIRFARQAKTVIRWAFWLKGVKRSKDHPFREPDHMDEVMRSFSLHGINPVEPEDKIASVISFWLSCASVQLGIHADGAGEWLHTYQAPGWDEGHAWDQIDKNRTRLGMKRYPPYDNFPRPGQRPSPIFALLVLQIADLISSREEVYYCKYCNQFFPAPWRARVQDRCRNPDCIAKSRNKYQRQWKAARRQRANEIQGE